MRTTLNINDALLKELKERAAKSGNSFRQVLEETIAAGLASQKASRTSKAFRIRPHALHLKPGFRKMSMNQLFDQLEGELDAK